MSQQLTVKSVSSYFNTSKMLETPPWVTNPKAWSHREKVPVVQIQMILKKKINQESRCPRFLPLAPRWGLPGAWTNVSKAVEWKPAMNGTKCLNMNALY